jgi:hypothetical protein
VDERATLRLALGLALGVAICMLLVGIARARAEPIRHHHRHAHAAHAMKRVSLRAQASEGPLTPTKLCTYMGGPKSTLWSCR